MCGRDGVTMGKWVAYERLNKIERGSEMKSKKEFKFDINAKKRRITDNEIIVSLEEFAKARNFKYFSTKEYNKWDQRIVWADTSTNDIENLQTLCWDCNQGKKDRD
jgi:hypothetical protein